MTTENYLHKRVRAVQEGNWRYAGKVTDEDELFLWLHDTKTARTVMLRKDSLLVLEVVE